MIDWLAISVALLIIATLVGIFGFVAWKISISDPSMDADIAGKKDDSNQPVDPVNDKKKREKSGNDASKKKRKDKKKYKRGSKEEEDEEENVQERPQHKVKFKEPSTQTSEETDNDREESEQESSPTTTPTPVETSSKLRKRNKNKRGPAAHVEGILINKDEKSPVTSQAAPIPHPILAVTIPKDEVELAKQHNHPGKPHTKASHPPVKQAEPTAAATAPPTKKTTSPPTNNNQALQKQQQQQQQQQEQPFTTVSGNRHKTVTPPAQQNKPVNSATNASAPVPPPVVVNTVVPPVQQSAPVQVQHQLLPQRQGVEKVTQVNGLSASQTPPKQTPVVQTALPTKIADIVKNLPSSQAIVTELMLALDAASLSTDELNIIMHKIANKQSVLKKDWTKLQQGQKVDPQAHIGQILDESARAFEEDLKTNAYKRIQELTDERNNDKRRISDLLKEKTDKEMEVQVLRAQLNSFQQPQQQFQTFQADFKRITEENLQLKQRLSQHSYQQQFAPLAAINNNTDPSNMQLRVLSEQVKKLSVDNGALEKQLKTQESLIKDAQKERDDLLRTNQQLLQKVQENQKQFQHNEEKLVKELNDSRTLQINQLNEFKGRLEQVESDNDKLRRENLVHKESLQTIASNNEERDKIEQELRHTKQQLIDESEKNKKHIEDIQNQYQSKENGLRLEIEQLKKTIEQVQQDNTQLNEVAAKTAEIDALRTELAAKTPEIDALRAELADAKTRNDAIRSQLEDNVRQEQNKHKEALLELLDQDIRNQLANDNQDFNVWFSSFQQTLKSAIESTKSNLVNESEGLKRENDQLLRNMQEVESQLKIIEQTVQSKEEVLLADLKNKDATLQLAINENEQLTGEMQRLRTEINRLKTDYDTATNKIRSLEVQLDEQTLLKSNTSPAVGTTNCEVDATTVSSSDQQQASENSQS